MGEWKRGGFLRSVDDVTLSPVKDLKRERPLEKSGRKEDSPRWRNGSTHPFKSTHESQQGGQ